MHEAGIWTVADIKNLTESGYYHGLSKPKFYPSHVRRHLEANHPKLVPLFKAVPEIQTPSSVQLFPNGCKTAAPSLGITSTFQKREREEIKNSDH